MGVAAIPLTPRLSFLINCNTSPLAVSLSSSLQQFPFQHIELAPKDILGDFPRLTKEAAHLVVTVTEAHRRGSPIDVDNLPGILEVKGRGFKCK